MKTYQLIGAEAIRLAEDMKAKGHYDSLTGLIPVLLICCFESSSGAAMAELEVTAERFPYHPGDRIEVMARNFVTSPPVEIKKPTQPDKHHYANKHHITPGNRHVSFLPI